MKPTEMQSLYQITQDLENVLTSIAENDGELSNDHETKMTVLFDLLKSKTDNIVSWVQSQNDLIDLAQAKVDQLKEFQTNVQTRLDRFDAYVNNCLTKLETDKIEGQLCTIKKRKPSQVVFIENESLLPIDFIRIPEPRPEVMKAEIAKLLKAGQEVPGAVLKASSKITINYNLKGKK